MRKSQKKSIDQNRFK